MSYRIEAIELYVRETKPGRMAFALGAKGGTGDVAEGLTNPLAHVRLVLRDAHGATTFGCAADRLSVRWLDKRPGREHARKLRELIDLIHVARDIYLEQREFDSPFQKWLACHPPIMQAGGRQGQLDLTSSFASALFERAVLDAACRLQGLSVFEALKQDRVGFRPSQIHAELGDQNFPATLPMRPLERISIRHTVGLSDPLTGADVPDDRRVNDGLPETLEQYIRVDGIRHFKVKISGDPSRDLQRLACLWDVVLAADQPEITLDANEAYSDLERFADFVDRLEREQTGLFQHILYIEQPLPRALTLDSGTKHIIRRISERKPLIIDEADGSVDAFSRAVRIGYRGTSHKNCKGFYKSLLNHALVAHHARQGERLVLSGEDLQNLPIVPLHQDFAAVAALGLSHCERNGHHYNYGLSMLSAKDKASVAEHHRDLYTRRGGEWFLRIRQGEVDCGSLQCPGFGVRDEPDWASMTPMRPWLEQRGS